MKATDVIRRDHRAIEELFATFKAASESEREDMEKMIFDALTAHERMEDKHFYPNVRDLMNLGDTLNEIEIEQKKLEVEVLAARVPRDQAKRIDSMMDKILAHAKKEETEILDKADTLIGDDKLEEIGDQMEPDSAVAKT